MLLTQVVSVKKNMELDKIIQFIDLKRDRKLNLLLTIFSTLVSGFLILFIVDPTYCKDLNLLLITMLSLSVIAPIYILNQIYSVVVVYRLSKYALRHVALFADQLKNYDKELNEFIFSIIDSITTNFIYNPPARQAGELITVLSSYLTVLISWMFKFSFIPTYFILFLCSSIMSWFTYFLFLKLIDELRPDHFKPLIKKLRKDESFKKRIKERLDDIEALIREKRKQEPEESGGGR